MKTKFLALLALLATASWVPLHAEWLELTNGDRYTGKVVAIHDDLIEFQSEIQGVIKLPRAKVAAIYFHAAPSAKAPSPSAAPSPFSLAPAAPAPGKTTEPPAAPLKSFQDLQQELASNPEAKQMFNEMVSGLFSGKISVADLRKQAEQAAHQLDEMKSELGDEAGPLLDGYLAILNNFLKQNPPPPASPAAPSTNAPPKTPSSSSK